MATTVKGDVVTIYKGGTEISAQMDCTYTESSDMIEITTKDSNGYKEYVRGDNGWTLSMTALVDVATATNLDELFAAAGIKQSTAANFQIGPFSGIYYGGDGFINNLTINAPRNGICDLSIEVQGSGEPRYNTLMST